MIDLVLDPVVRGSSLQIRLTIDDSFDPTADYSSAQLWFYAKQSTTDSDADAVIQLTNDVNGGIVQSNTRKQDVLVSADNVGAALRNYNTTLQCELKLKMTDGFEGAIARGPLELLAAIAPHD